MSSSSGQCLKQMQLEKINEIASRIMEIIESREFLNVIFTGGWASQITRQLIKNNDEEMVKRYSQILEQLIEEGLGDHALEVGIQETYVINAQRCLNTLAKHFNLNS